MLSQALNANEGTCWLPSSDALLQRMSLAVRSPRTRAAGRAASHYCHSAPALRAYSRNTSDRTYVQGQVDGDSQSGGLTGLVGCGQGEVPDEHGPGRGLSVEAGIELPGESTHFA